ncbi:hypothetical protein VF13_39790 [Nostoc linckia z16]|nr:hypothetical protein VF13_39790 [Nostoc linckia z16]
MQLIYFLLSIGCFIVGVGFINFYNELIDQKKQSDFSFKFRTAGIGFIITGAILLIKFIKFFI